MKFGDTSAKEKKDEEVLEARERQIFDPLKKIFDYCDSTNKNFNMRIPLILENLEDIFKTIYNINYRLYSISLYSKNKYLGFLLK